MVLVGENRTHGLPPSTFLQPGPSPERSCRGARCAAVMLIATTLCLLIVLGPATAEAKAHLWRISEIFSNADGTVQFIELNECCGSVGETALTNTSLTSNANSYDFPNNLDFFPGTAFGWVLIATADFAALPGAPTPDYIIPANFFDPAGDTITYVGGADVAVLAPGALPTDGLHALERDISSGALTVAVNSPRNYPGDSGSVSPPAPVATGSPALVAGIALLVGSAALVGLRRAAGARA